MANDEHDPGVYSQGHHDLDDVATPDVARILR